MSVESNFGVYSQKPIIIGLGHRARAGKDALAEHLVKNHGFKQYALADLLKQSVNIVMGWNDRHSYGDLKEQVDPSWGTSPRWMYQNIGTGGWRTIFREDVWAQALRLKLERDCIGVTDFRAVITDVRFRAGEVEMVKQLGGSLWKIDRPSLAPLKLPPKSFVHKTFNYLRGKDDYSHVSETDLHGWNGWDEVIVNDGSLEVLYAKGEDALARIMKANS